uniref:Uncharacterized protein n=1 Tax=Arundo donax TaxID=35708 RepID=A0A0A9FYH0_ARUDO
MIWILRPPCTKQLKGRKQRM